jgi:DNA-directed RNA polymerase specialized sigma24 family protein
MHKPAAAHWRDVQFEPEQWANIPESAGLWSGVSPDEATDRRLRTGEEIGLILKAVMLTALTPRQQRVLELYYYEAHTQIEIATALGITQQNVSQHLAGKFRGQSRVGGAFNKIRKAIQKAAKRRGLDDTRYRQIIQTLDQLLSKSITHRRAGILLVALARTDPGAGREK